ncbi:phage tail tape measure protein [Rhodococcus rhodnii]|uniref:phage tail tape measure protein n=1 Tax=Rhodococcus rhodnii TaxID=38312 RepID=UPI001EE6EFFA|nr:phage tail tape measure protein [Rhodococcus rhodnii]
MSVGAGMAFQKVIAIGNDFTATMNEMQAVSSATAAQMQAVSDRARALGNDISLPGTSASDAAAAMTELAKGGFTVEQSMAAAKGTLQLAAAAQIDAASAATIQSQALQSFGLNADYAAKTADILANAANASSAEIGGIAQGLQQSGTVANQFGLSIEDTSAALAMFANAGIQGSDAGTLLKAALLSLTDQGNPAQGAIEQLGLTVYDTEGKFVGLSALFGQLQEASANMTPEMYQAATATLFGSDAMRLAGIAAEQGQTGFDSMVGAINRQGSAAEVAAAKTKGLPGAMESVVNSAEELALGLYDLIDGPMESFARGAADKLSGATDGIVSGFKTAADAAAAVGGFFMDLPGPVQALTASLLALRITGLNGTVNALGGGLTSAARSGSAAMRSFGAEVRLTREYAAAADRPVGVLRGSMLTLADSAGGARGALSGLRSAGSAVVSALGGAWTLGLAAAAVAVGSWATNVQQAKAHAEAYDAALQKIRSTQSALGDIFSLNQGAYDEQAIANIAEQVNLVSTAFGEAAANDAKWNNVMTDVIGDIVMPWRGASDDISKSMDEIALANRQAQEAIEKTGLTSEQIAQKTGADDETWAQFERKLRASGEGGDFAAEKLSEIRGQVQDLNEVAKNATPGFFSLNEAVKTLADESASASDQVNAMKVALDILAGKPVALSDALQQYHAQVRETAAATQEAWDASQGWALELRNEDGSVNTATANGDRLKQALDGIRDSTINAAVAGADMAPIWASNEEQFAQLAEATGLSIDQIRQMAIEAGLVPDRITMLASLEGVETVEGQLAVIGSMLQTTGQPVDIPIDALTDAALLELEQVGVEVDKVDGKPGIVRLSAPNEEVLKQIQAVIDKNIPGKDATVTFRSQGDPAARAAYFGAANIQGPMPIGGNEAGGRLPGYAAGGRMPARSATDDIFAVLPNGTPIAKVNGKEWVINADASQEYDRELAMINAGIFPKLPGFETGGRLAVDRTEQQLRAQSGKPYQYGGVGNPSFDCSGLVSFAYALLTGKDPGQRWFTTESDFAALGFLPGLGGPDDLSIGVHNGGGGQYSHMAGTLAGVPFESGSNGVIYGAGAAGADDAQFENRYHLPGGAFNPPFVGGSSGYGGAAASSWTEKDELDLKAAQAALLKATEDLSKTQAGFDEGKKTPGDLEQSKVRLQQAELKVRELEQRKGSPSSGGPAPDAPGLSARYSDADLEQRDLERAVIRARERRNEVYADPDSTPTDRQEADDNLQKAEDTLAKGGRGEKESVSANIADRFGDAVGSAVSGQIEDALGIVGLDGQLGAVGASLKLATELQQQQADLAKQGAPSFTRDELAKQGPVTPGTQDWIEELLKTLQVPMVLRDTGGPLPHGVAGLNLSGEEEWVLTGAQRRQHDRDLAELAALRASRGGVDMAALTSQMSGGDFSIHVNNPVVNDGKKFFREMNAIQSRQMMRFNGRPRT